MPEKIKEKENLSEAGFKKELDAYLTQRAKNDVFSGAVLVAKEGKTIFKTVRQNIRTTCYYWMS